MSGGGRKFTGSRLLVATHNAGKLKEITELLAPRGIEVVGAAQMQLAEPEETETTFAGNARIKALAAVKATGLPALADDSGIEIDCLNGAPGVYTADWAETPSGRDFRMAMEKSWQKIQESGASAPFTARFCCTLVLAWPDGGEEIVRGDAEGECVWPMRGVEGHGYDPMFQPTGHTITFGEMAAEEKNRISHRALALEKLIERCF